mgnify:FL=1
MLLQNGSRDMRRSAPKERTENLSVLTVRSIVALILREMSATSGRTPGGYLWAILEPVLGIAFLSYIFSLGFRTPRLGDNFPIFFATGLLPFLASMMIAGSVSQALNYSRALLNYPMVSYMDALIARLILTTMTQMMVSVILLFGIVSVWETRTVFEIERALLTYTMAIAFGFGLGVFNCFFVTRFQLYQRIFSIATRPLFLMSGVIFLYESLPRFAQNILWYNPLMHVTGELRGAFYLQYEAKYVSPVYVFSVSLILCLLGFILLHRYHRDMLEY